MADKEKSLSIYDTREALIVLSAERLLRKFNFKWEMKNGTLIDIKKMSDKHLDNTIKMLKRIEEDYAFLSDIDMEE